MNSPETQAKIASKMERFVFDPTLSRNPAILPKSSSGKEAVPILIPYAEFVLANDEDSEIELKVDLACYEPGESLTLLIDKGADSDLASTSRPVNFEEISRTVFCNVRKSNDYDRKEENRQ